MNFFLVEWGRNMNPDDTWVVYSTTEDDFVELERCSERLREMGIRADAIGAMTLHCHSCILSGNCLVARENVFLGARTC